MDSQRPTPDLLVVVRRQWLLIALAVLVAAAVAFAVSRAQDKRYTASASLGFDVSTPLSNLLGQGSAPSADVQEREAATIADLVAARSVANRTARVVHRSPQAVADAIDVQAKGVSNIITVSATDRSPRFAARLANAYAATYVHTRRQDDSRSDQRALAAVHAQLARLTPRERQSSAGRLLQERADQLAAVAPLDQGSIALVSAAHVPSSPSSPQTKLNVLLGALVGLLIGSAFAVVRERTRASGADATELGDALEAPVLGALPYDRRLGPDSEAVQALNVRLRHYDFGREVRVILLTAAQPRDGTSTVAWQIASAAAADGGRRVLLVEADLRRPGSAGLADVLRGGLRWDEAVRSAADGAFDVLPAGTAGSGSAPYRLFDTPAMQDLLRDVREAYDLVLIDGAPLGDTLDTIPLTKQVDGVLVVARAGGDAGPIAALGRQLKALRAPVLGVVANGVRGRSAGALAPTPRAILAAGVVVVVLGIAGLAFAARSGDDSEKSSAVKPTPTAPKTSRAPGLPSCARAAGNRSARVTCRTRDATLTIAHGAEPVLVPGLQARVIRGSVAAGRLAVRVRLRNTSPRPRVFNAGHRQIYVATGGRRLYAVPAQGPIALAPGQGVTSTLQFAWQGPLGSRRVDIALVPWSEVGRRHPRRLGIIRLQLAARR